MLKLHSVFLFFTMFSAFAFAAEDSDKVKKYPSSTNDGSHRSLTTDVYGFTPVSTAPGVDQTVRCAGRKSTFSISREDAENAFVEFYSIESPKGKDTCPVAVLPERGSEYKIAKNIYSSIDAKYNGLAFGGLVVPFKFRLGSDKKLVNSITAAPYIGLRYSWLQFYGYEIKPVISAGIASVSVPTDDGKGNDTKAAFSSSVGLMLSSANQSTFSAGILFGKDFLSKSERANDPSVVKPWLSIWLGVPIP